MKLLSQTQILMLQEQLITETGGLHGLRDGALLESALSVPFQSYGGVDVYPSLQQKAARLCYGLVMNHPFADGNKRIGAHAMLVFLSLNGIGLSYTQEELADVILRLADGTASYPDLLHWLMAHQL